MEKKVPERGLVVLHTQPALAGVQEVRPARTNRALATAGKNVGGIGAECDFWALFSVLGWLQTLQGSPEALMPRRSELVCRFCLPFSQLAAQSGESWAGDAQNDEIRTLGVLRLVRSELWGCSEC